MSESSIRHSAAYRRVPKILILLLFLGTLCLSDAHARKKFKTKKMPLRRKTEQIDFSKGAVAFLGVELKGMKGAKENVKPVVARVGLREQDSGQIYVFSTAADTLIPLRWNWPRLMADVQIISVQVPPGSYELFRISGKGMITERGFGSGYASSYGQWTLGLNYQFTLEGNEVFYLGHLSGSVVERENDDEEPACGWEGPRRPNPNEGALWYILEITASRRENKRAGFLNGTFRHAWKDKFESDLALVLQEYEWFGQISVKNRALSEESQMPE